MVIVERGGCNHVGSVDFLRIFRKFHVSAMKIVGGGRPSGVERKCASAVVNEDLVRFRAGAYCIAKLVELRETVALCDGTEADPSISLSVWNKEEQQEDEGCHAGEACRKLCAETA
jgi:hypothetical protein